MSAARALAASSCTSGCNAGRWLTANDTSAPRSRARRAASRAAAAADVEIASVTPVKWSASSPSRNASVTSLLESRLPAEPRRW